MGICLKYCAVQLYNFVLNPHNRPVSMKLAGPWPQAGNIGGGLSNIEAFADPFGLAVICENYITLVSNKSNDSIIVMTCIPTRK